MCDKNGIITTGKDAKKNNQILDLFVVKFSDKQQSWRAD